MHGRVPYDEIDQGIRNLCRTINEHTPFETRYSCEGHVPLSEAHREASEMAHVGFLAPNPRPETCLQIADMARLVEDGKPYEILVQFRPKHTCRLHENALSVVIEPTLFHHNIMYTEDDKRIVNRDFIKKLEKKFEALSRRTI